MFQITRNVLEFLTRDPCSVNLEKDYEKIKTNLRIFRNVTISYIYIHTKLYRCITDELMNLKHISEISRDVDTGTGTSEGNKATSR